VLSSNKLEILISKHCFVPDSQTFAHNNKLLNQSEIPWKISATSTPIILKVLYKIRKANTRNRSLDCGKAIVSSRKAIRIWLLKLLKEETRCSRLSFSRYASI
jgi:hypothetical protein